MSHHETSAKGEGARMVDRMVFFSDAVFAIVLTLLVLELRPPQTPHHDEAALTNGLWQMGREFIAFAISFALVGVFWAAHMRITRRLQVFDWWVAVANLYFLFAIALMPFASAVLGEHISSPVAMQAYAIILVQASIAQVLLWTVTARGSGKLIGGISAREFWVGLLRGATPGIVFAAVLALIGAGRIDLARWAPLVIAPVILLTRLIGGKQPPPA